MAEVTDSDKLAIALACAAGVMAVILFLIEKTPLTVALSLVAMLGLAIYPILHFFRKLIIRLAVFVAMLGIATLIGWQAWPIKSKSLGEVAAPSQVTPPSASQNPLATPKDNPAPIAKPRAKSPPSQPVPPKPSMSQECAPGAVCAQSSGQQGGITAGVYNGPPPLELKATLEIVPSDKGTFGFPANECPVKTRITITPNQAVPPPIAVALDFDNPISKIASTVLGVSGQMGGGPYRLGTNALAPPISSPGITATHPLLVEVCSAEILKLTAAPRLE